MEYTNIHPDIQRTLLNRVDGLNRRQKITDALEPRSETLDDKHIQSILAKTCWARVHSSIVDGDTGKLFRLSSAFTGTGRSAQPLSAVESKGNLSKISNRLVGKYKGTALTSEPNMFNNDKSSRFRPHSGITSISTQFKGLLIQNATINWTFYDKEQFKRYEDALMRHGRFVLLEFGWTTPKIFGSPRFENLDDMLSSYRRMRDKIRESGGNYYQTLGKIKSFNYSIGNSGEFKCTTELMSMGNDMFSSKIETDSKKTSLSINYSDEDAGEAFQKTSNTFSNFMKSLDEHIKEDYFGKSTKGVYYQMAYQPTAPPGQTPPPPKPGYDKGWCSWGWFEDKVLNTFFGLTDKNELFSLDETLTIKDLLSYMRSKVGGWSNTCRTHSKIATLDTDVILPGKTKGLDILYKEAEKEKASDDIKKLARLHKAVNSDTFRRSNRFDAWENSDGGVIRNFVFSSDYLKQGFGSGISNLDSALQSFWDGVSSKYGGFWQFKVYQDKDDAGQIGMRDDNNTSKDSVTNNTTKDPDNVSTKDDLTKNFKFKVYSTDSLIKDYNFSIDMSSAMATQTMFHSNKKYGDDGDNGKAEESLAIRALGSLRNQTMADNPTDKNTTPPPEVVLTTPIANNKMVSIKGQDTMTIEDISAASKYAMKNMMRDMEKQQQEADLKIRDEETIEKYGEGFYDFNTGEDGKVSDLVYDLTGKLLEPFARTIKAQLNGAMIDPESGEATTEPVLPMTKLSFSLNGIAGIEPLDIFSIDYLPDVYREKTVFQVTSTSHDVSPQGWTTKIEASMRLSAQLMVEDADSKLTPGDQLKLKKFKSNQITELSSAVNRQEETSPAPSSKFKSDELAKYYSSTK